MYKVRALLDWKFSVMFIRVLLFFRCKKCWFEKVINNWQNHLYCSIGVGEQNHFNHFCFCFSFSVHNERVSTMNEFLILLVIHFPDLGCIHLLNTCKNYFNTSRVSTQYLKDAQCSLEPEKVTFQKFGKYLDSS